MMWSSAMTRRKFLGAVAAALGLIALRPFRAVLSWLPRPPREPFGERLGRLLPDAASAAVVGRVYLEGAPQEAHAERLEELLCPRRQRQALLAAPASRLRSWLHQRRRWDFAKERTVLVHGWMLSITEARLCALVALRAGRSA